MKKKEIEKIPYMTLPAADPDEKVLYIGRIAWRNIGHERHIFLEIYENMQNGMPVPLLRYVATKKEWGIYDISTESWSRKSIKYDIWSNGLCWQKERDRTKQENRLYSEDDLIRIKNFFQDIKVWREEHWWEYFEENENRIKRREKIRKYERRKERLGERQENTPPLEEQALLKWADLHLFHEKHYLYYKKEKKRADLCCTACGGLYSGRWRERISYESRFERHVEEPREGNLGRCILCGKTGIYKPRGKARAQNMKSHVFLADRYLDNGVVLRYIKLEKEWRLEEICLGKDQEMLGAYEKLYGVEIARTYFLPGKKIQTDFHKHDAYKGEDFWDDCNLYGNANICINKAAVHPETFSNLQGTFLQYSGLKEYVAALGEVNAKEYLMRYINYPQLEMLVKLKLYKTAERITGGYGGIIEDHAAERPDQVLGIRKDKVKLLIEGQGDLQLLKILKKEKMLGHCWTWQQVWNLVEIEAGEKNLCEALGIMSVQKFLNNISKYAGCEYGTGCSTATARLRQKAITYMDYLNMRKSLGYDMSNTVYQKPRDLEAAHDSMVLEANKEKYDKRVAEVEEMFKDIRKNYRKLRERYFYEDEMYVIRPARSAEEIVKEGRILHHCVGGNDYLRKHNSGITYILMLRFKDAPETPYITVEICGRTDSIIQWYGSRDKKTDEKNMQRWLKEYVRKLKGEHLEVEEETEQELLMAAV